MMHVLNPSLQSTSTVNFGAQTKTTWRSGVNKLQLGIKKFIFGANYCSFPFLLILRDFNMA